METLNEVAMVYLGGNQVANIWMGEDHVWPRDFAADLVPSYAYGGQYDISSVPASGGTVTVTWRLIVTQNGSEVYNQPVTPTSVVSVSDSNFSYERTTGVWTAPSRGTNGFSSNDSATPTAAQLNPGTRTCTVTVEFSGNVTINGASRAVTRQGSSTMTQQNNPGQAGSVTYSSILVYLAAYDMGGDYAAPAGDPNNTNRAVKTLLSAVSGYKYQWYHWASNAPDQYYQTALDAYRDYTYSTSANWVSVSNSSTQRAVTIASRETTAGAERSATITATVKNTSVSGSVTVYQKLNQVEQTIAGSDTPTSFTLTSPGNVSIYGETKYLSGTWSGVRKADEYVWSSTAHSGGATTNISGQQAVPTAYKIGTYGTEVSGNAWTVAANTRQTTAKSFDVYGKYGDIWSAKVTVTQPRDYYTDSSVTYNYAVSLSASADSFSASGGSITFSAYSATYYYATVRTWDSDPGNPDYGTPVPRTASVTASDITVTKGGTASGYGNRIFYTHASRKITHTSMQNNEGTDTVTVRLTHPMDSTTYQEYSQTATNTATYGTVTVAPTDATAVPASGGSRTFTASCPITWTSQYPNDSTTNFSFAISTRGNGSSRTYDINASTGKLDFGTLGENTKTSTATTRVTATHNVRSSVTGTGSITEATNRRTDSTYATGTNYTYDNWNFSMSINRYYSESSPAPKAASTATLSLTAKHRVNATPWTQTKYDWESGASRINEPVNGSTTRTTVSDLGTLTINAESPWVTVGAVSESSTVGSGTAAVSIAANTGSARHTIIVATRPAMLGEASSSLFVHVNQKAGNVAISLSPNAVTLGPDGGTVVITVSATSTTWKVTTQSWGLSGTTLVPAANSSGQSGTTVTLTVGIYQTRRRTGTIKVTADEDSTIYDTCVITQEPGIIPD